MLFPPSPPANQEMNIGRGKFSRKSLGEAAKTLEELPARMSSQLDESEIKLSSFRN